MMQMLANNLFNCHYICMEECASWLHHSLEKVVPSLFSSLKITSFLRQNTDFSAQNDPSLTIKHRPFSPQWTLFFVVDTDFSAQMKPHFHSKTLDIKINPLFSKCTEVSTKISPFSRKMRILDFLKKYPFIREF